MRILSFLLVAAVSIVGFAQVSHAGKATYKWTKYKGFKHNFEPYMGQQKLKQRSIWDNDTWTPQDWIDNPGDEKIILRDFYSLGILKEQYTRKGTPVLDVGEKFIQLSGFDQRRVLEFVDYVFQITAAKEDGVFIVYYDKNKKQPLGVYNQYGFQNY